MKIHKQWLKDVRGMNRSVAARSGAMAPLWIIRFVGEAYRAGDMSREVMEKILADVRGTLGIENENIPD